MHHVHGDSIEHVALGLGQITPARLPRLDYPGQITITNTSYPSPFACLACLRYIQPIARPGCCHVSAAWLASATCKLGTTDMYSYEYVTASYSSSFHLRWTSGVDCMPLYAGPGSQLAIDELSLY